MNHGAFSSVLRTVNYLTLLPRQSWLLICIFVGALSACSESDRGCTVTSDSIQLTDQLIVGDRAYFLFHRVSGWHEKVESFEIYHERPVFDECGDSNIQYLFGASVDNRDENNNEQYIDRILLEYPDKFVLQYKLGPPPRLDYYQTMKLEKMN